MQSIYRIWITISPESVPNENNYRWFIIQVINHLAILAQNIQFFWNFDLPINNWEKYQPFWNSINAPSFDVIAVRYNAIHHFFIFEILMLAIVLLSLFFVGILNAFEKEIPRPFLYVLRVLLIFQCELSFIPTSIFFFVIDKYSSISTIETVIEYPDNLSSNYFNYGIIGQAASIIVITILLLLSIMYELCTYSSKHTLSTSNTSNKVTAKCCILNKIVYFCNTYMFISFQLTNYQAFLILSILLYGLCSVYLIVNLPFYSYKMNFIKIFVHFDCFILGIIFLAGFYFDNPGVITLLSISMQFIICPLIYSLIAWRTSKNLPIDISVHQKFSSFELTIRESLILGDLSELLLEKLRRNYKFNNEATNLITQAYYADEIMQNSMLGLNIITKVQPSGFDISTNCQVYRCKIYLTKKAHLYSNSIKIIEYFNNFSSTKENDKKLCQILCKLVNQLQIEKLSLSHLKELITGTVNSYKILKEQYKILHKKNADSIEIQDYYNGSLLARLLGDVKCDMKFFSVYKSNKNIDRQYAKAYNFQENRCFFVVSCTRYALGKIIDFDRNFLNFLSYSLESAKELYIENLIVSEYCRNPNKALKKFIGKSLTHQALINTVIPLLSSEGFLCEGIINSELISYKDSLHFICSIDSLQYKYREIALLDKLGVIIGHSKYFTKLLGIDKKIMIGVLISEIMPEIFCKDVCEDAIFSIKKVFNRALDSELNGVLKKTVHGESEQLILYVTDSDQELNSWKNHFEEFYCENEFNDNHTFSFESTVLNSHTLNIEKNEIPSQMGIDSITKSNKERTLESNKPDSLANTAFELKSLKKAVIVLNVTKIVLLLSILVMIIFSISILSYIFQESNESNSLATIISLGDICYLLAQSSFVLRYIDVSIRSNYTPYYTFEDANALLSTLENKKIQFMNLYNKGTYCTSSKIAIENIVPYWKIDKKPKIYFSNLPNIIDIFLLNAGFILSHMQEGYYNYSDHMFFTTYISMGNTFDFIHKSMQDIKKCETDKIDKLEITNEYLFFVGFVVLGCCFVFLLGFLLTIDKNLNFLWDHLRSKILSKSLEIKKAVSDQIVKQHENANIISDEIESHNHKNTKKVIFYHSLNYLWKFSILFIFVTIFYLLNSYIFEAQVLINMRNRPELISIILQRRVMSSKMCFLTLEVDLESSDLALFSLYPEFNTITPPEDKLKNIIEFLTSSQLIITSQSSQNLMSTTLINIILKGDLKNKPFLTLGSIQGLTYLTQESRFLTNNGMQDKPAVMSKFIEQVKEYSNLGEIATGLAKEDSKNTIKAYMNQLLLFNIICCIMLLIAYAFYYYPFLNFEIRLLYKITKVLKLISRGFNK